MGGTVAEAALGGLLRARQRPRSLPNGPGDCPTRDRLARRDFAPRPAVQEVGPTSKEGPAPRSARRCVILYERHGPLQAIGAGRSCVVARSVDAAVDVGVEHGADAREALLQVRARRGL